MPISRSISPKSLDGGQIGGGHGNDIVDRHFDHSAFYALRGRRAALNEQIAKALLRALPRIGDGYDLIVAVIFDIEAGTRMSTDSFLREVVDRRVERIDAAVMQIGRSEIDAGAAPESAAVVSGGDTSIGWRRNASAQNQQQNDKTTELARFASVSPQECDI